MQLSTSHCRNCHLTFEHPADEAAFLEKVSPVFEGQKYQIPAPELCPSCRFQRRLAFRNQIYVGKVKSSATGAALFSMHFGESHFPVVEKEMWWAREDMCAENYGREFDFSRTFFEQFLELRNSVPRPAIATASCENCDYSNNMSFCKNCYFVFDASNCEDCMYLETAENCKDCVDCSQVFQMELCYDCVACLRCYQLQSSDFCQDCSDSYFLRSCNSCRNCFGCCNLRQARFCIFNQQVSEHEYHRFLAQQNLASFQQRSALKAKYLAHARQQPIPHMVASQVENCSGNHIHASKAIENSFIIIGSENLRNCFNCAAGTRDCQDLTIWGDKSELLYDCSVCGYNLFQVIFSVYCYDGCAQLAYCDLCMSCQDCFGCVGLIHQKHCIFNKQYSPEEYQRLAGKIIQHMQSTGEWGQFFPLQCSSSPYNLTLAQRYFPLSETQAIGQGIPWHTIETPLAGHIDEIPDQPPEQDKALISCSDDGRPFRITSEEIKRYRKLSVPLPRLPYDLRMELRAKRMGSMQIVPRACAFTGKVVLTGFMEDEYPVVCEREELLRQSLG